MESKSSWLSTLTPFTFKSIRKPLDGAALPSDSNASTSYVPQAFTVPTKNTFVNFPVPRTPSEEDALFSTRPPHSCPASGLMAIDEEKQNSAVATCLPDALYQANLETIASSSVGKCKSSVKRSATSSAEIDSSFVLLLELTDQHRSLGLVVDYTSENDVTVKSIDDGLVRDWNRAKANRGHKIVQIGDLILAINDITEPERMLKECIHVNEKPKVVAVRILSRNMQQGPEGSHPCNQGSKNHAQGLCRPCAYFHRAHGCGSEGNCKYCHECLDGELIRRKQMKLLFRKMMYSIHKHRNKRDESASADNGRRWHRASEGRCVFLLLDLSKIILE